MNGGPVSFGMPVPQRRSLLLALVMWWCACHPLLAQDTIRSAAQDLDSSFAVRVGADKVFEPLAALARVRSIHASAVLIDDTLELGRELKQYADELALVSGHFTDTVGHPRLRALRDDLAELDRLRTRVEGLLRPVGRQLAELSAERAQLAAEIADAQALTGVMPGADVRSFLTFAKATVELLDARHAALLHQQGRGLEILVNATLERDRLAGRLVVEEADVRNRRYPPVWKAAAWHNAPMGPVLRDSLRVLVEGVERVGANFWKQLVLLRVVVVLFALLPLWHLRRTLRKGPATPYSERMRLLQRYPAEMGAITVLVVTPLLFRHVPPLAYDLFFLGMLAPLARVFLRENPFINRIGFVGLLVFTVLLLLANMLVEVTTFKRVLLLLAIALVPRGVVFLRGLKKSGYADPRRATVVVGLVVVQAVVGWLANLFGWYRLGSNLITVAVSMFWLAVALRIAVDAVNDYLLLVADLRHRRGGARGVDLLHAHARIRGLLDLLAIGFWIYSYLHAMDLSELLWSRLDLLLNAPRALAGLTFTWGSVLLFGGVIWASYVLSELLRELFHVPDEAVERRSSGFALLLRLVVLVGGTLLAFALTGIPMDRLAMVLGAFGVGIGFGLQNLTNNLVSGVMLALEKPVRPGDQIEVKGASGTVVDIGIRSTRVINPNGTALIVPNGMLLSELVANRTLTDRTGEVLVQVYVPVTNDMERVLGLVEELVKRFAEADLRHPVVHLAEIGKAWALIEVRLWVHDVRLARDRRSEVLRAISHTLLTNGVDMDVAPNALPGSSEDN